MGEGWSVSFPTRSMCFCFCVILALRSPKWIKRNKKKTQLTCYLSVTTRALYLTLNDPPFENDFVDKGDQPCINPWPALGQPLIRPSKHVPVNILSGWCPKLARYDGSCSTDAGGKVEKHQNQNILLFFSLQERKNLEQIYSLTSDCPVPCLSQLQVCFASICGKCKTERTGNWVKPRWRLPRLGLQLKNLVCWNVDHCLKLPLWWRAFNGS